MNGKWTNAVWPGIYGGRRGGLLTNPPCIVFRKMPPYFAEIKLDIQSSKPKSIAKSLCLKRSLQILMPKISSKPHQERLF